jgi:hypothetical protein
LSTLWLFPFSSHHGVSPIKGSNALDLGRTLAGLGGGQNLTSRTAQPSKYFIIGRDLLMYYHHYFAMDLALTLNRATGKAVMFLLLVLSRLISIPWFYQFMEYLFSFPDSSLYGFFLNIAMILILCLLIVMASIVRLNAMLRKK